MKSRTKGMIVAVVGTIGYVLLSFGSSLLYEQFTNEGWAGIGLLFLLLGIGAIPVLIGIVYGVYTYMKHKSEFGVGLLYGFVGLIGFFLFQLFLSTLFRW